MKTFKSFVHSLMESATKESIRKHLWHSYRTDPVHPAKETHPTHMSDEDYDDFEDHVDEVHAHAKKHGIGDARKAIDSYTDEITKVHKPHGWGYH